MDEYYETGTYEVIGVLWDESYKDYTAFRTIDLPRAGNYVLATVHYDLDEVDVLMLYAPSNIPKRIGDKRSEVSGGYGLTTMEYKVEVAGEYRLNTKLRTTYPREFVTLVLHERNGQPLIQDRHKHLVKTSDDYARGLEDAMNAFVRQFQEQTEWVIVKADASTMGQTKSKVLKRDLKKDRTYKLIVGGAKAETGNVMTQNGELVVGTISGRNEKMLNKGEEYPIQVWDFTSPYKLDDAWIGLSWPSTTSPSSFVYVLLAEPKPANGISAMVDHRYFNFHARDGKIKLEERKLLEEREARKKYPYRYQLVSLEDEKQRLVDSFQFVYPLNENHFYYRAFGKYGVADNNGNRVTPAIADDFVEITVKGDGLFRYMNRIGYWYYASNGNQASIRSGNLIQRNGRIIEASESMSYFVVYDQDLNVLFKGPRKGTQLDKVHAGDNFITYRIHDPDSGAYHYETYIIDYDGNQVYYEKTTLSPEEIGNGYFKYNTWISHKKKKLEGYGYGVKNADFKVVIPPSKEYEDILDGVSPNGSVVVAVKELGSKDYGTITYGILAPGGDWVVKPGKYMDAMGFEGEWAALREDKNDEYVWYNQDGDKVKENPVKEFIGANGSYIECDKRGCQAYNTKGEEILDDKFEKIDYACPGRLIVARKDKTNYYYTNDWQKVEIPGLLYCTGCSSDSIARFVLKSDDKKSVLYNWYTGETVSKPMAWMGDYKSKEIFPFKYESEGEIGFMNNHGKNIVKPGSSEKETWKTCRGYLLYRHLYEDKPGGEWRVIDSAGNVLHTFEDEVAAKVRFVIPEYDLYAIER